MLKLISESYEFLKGVLTAKKDKSCPELPKGNESFCIPRFSAENKKLCVSLRS